MPVGSIELVNSPVESQEINWTVAWGTVVGYLREVQLAYGPPRLVGTSAWPNTPAAALTAWEERDPAGWARVSAWLTAKRVTIVRI